MRLGIILILSISFYVAMPHSEAAQENYHGKAIGIVISDTCLTMAKQKMKSTCPENGYGSLLSLDNSNQKWSGKFVTKDGIIQRGPAQYPKSDLRAYAYNSTFFIFVDPPKASRSSLPLITIETSIPEYHKIGQFTVQEIKIGDAKPVQSVRVYSKDRWIDSTCTNAAISSKGGMDLLIDTINYMKSNCNPNYTKITTIVNDVKNLTKHDISTSYKWKLDTQYQYIKANCLQKYGECSSIVQATRGGLPNLASESPLKKHLVIRLNG